MQDEESKGNKSMVNEDGSDTSAVEARPSKRVGLGAMYANPKRLFVPRAGETDFPILSGSREDPSNYLMCFSCRKKLKAMLTAIGADFDQVTTIRDVDMFVSSFPIDYDGAPLRLMLDPTFTDDGLLVFHQVTEAIQ